MVTPNFNQQPDLRLKLDPDPRRASELRTRLHDWLGQAGATPEEIFDVSVACSEAFANAIEHPLDPADPRVDVEGVVSDGELVIAISDHGGWREHRQREEGGMGLPLMRSLMGSIDVDRRPEGTTIVLRRSLRASLAA
jgi:anti-sigma regulatory factor (Ser/Thr protein kinase)